MIVGIRPENIEDASIMPVIPQERRVTTRVNLREALGAEVLVHFPVDAPPVLTEDTRELAGDTGREALTELEKRAAAGETTWVARLDPRTQAKERETLELAVDTARMHFFDPETKLGIYGDGR